MASQWPSPLRVSLRQSQTTPISREKPWLWCSVSAASTHTSLERNSSSKRTTNLSKWFGGNHSGVHHHAYSGYSSKSKVTSVTFATNLESTWVLSDTLSRLPNPRENRAIPTDLTVESVYTEIEDVLNIDLMSFGQSKREELQKETASDPVLRALWQLVTSGWPDSIQEVPTALRTFWPYRDELGVAHGVLFKGRQVVIPSTLQDDILNQLHVGHMGIERTRRLARETVFWPNMLKRHRTHHKDLCCMPGTANEAAEGAAAATWHSNCSMDQAWNRPVCSEQGRLSPCHWLPLKVPLGLQTQGHFQQGCRGDHEWGSSAYSVRPPK